MKAQEFIAIVAPVAVKLRLEGSPIFPSVRIAQAFQETGGVIHSWNNVVGYKVGSGEPNAYWRGETMSLKTWEVVDGARYDIEPANWRAYQTIEDCFRDHDLLFERERYRRVREAQTPLEQTAALHACGYATDPQYPWKIYTYIVKYDLPQFDKY